MNQVTQFGFFNTKIIKEKSTTPKEEEGKSTDSPLHQFAANYFIDHIFEYAEEVRLSRVGVNGVSKVEELEAWSDLKVKSFVLASTILGYDPKAMRMKMNDIYSYIQETKPSRKKLSQILQIKNVENLSKLFS